MRRKRSKTNNEKRVKNGSRVGKQRSDEKNCVVKIPKEKGPVFW